MSQLAFFGNTIRRIFNSFEYRMDKRVLNQEVRSVHRLNGGKTPLTACEALSKIWPVVQDMDENAFLKSVSSPTGVDINGKSARWNFNFELQNRRARLQCFWLLPWDDREGDYGQSILDARAKPYPPEDSVYRQMVSQGRILCRELNVLWQAERKRRPDLPLHFRDSDVVVRELVQKGLDVDAHNFTLSSVKTIHGKLNWLAKVDDYAFFADFLPQRN